VENFCGIAEVPDDADGGDWLSIPLNDVKALVNEITSIRSKNILHKVPVDTITRLLQVIEHQIRCSQGLSIDVKENVSYLPSLLLRFQFCQIIDIGFRPPDFDVLFCSRTIWL
jgi:hypothetical protein